MNINETDKLQILIDDLDHLILKGSPPVDRPQFTITDGILTRDPNLRNLPNDTSVCDFAIDLQDSEWDPHPYILTQGIVYERFLCIAYGQTADIISNYYRKDSPINISCFHWAKEPTRATSNITYEKQILFVNEVALPGIQQICYERDIQTLCHFTRVERLRSILYRGFLNRSLLESLPSQIRPQFTDQDRDDGFKDAICLSISFPNYRMFFSKTGRDNQHEWVVLLLDAKILWELDCAFCHQNARFEPVLDVPLEYRKRLISLKRMFWDSDSHSDGSIYQRQQIPNNYPTHPEAEVLIFYPIPAAYIKEVHFYNEDSLKAWQQENDGTFSQRFCANESYFRPRCDYKAWQKPKSQ